MPATLSNAYDFLTRSFAANQVSELEGKLKNAGRLVSKREGRALGLDADTFADFYDNVRQPGRSVSRTQLMDFAKERFAEQMEALRDGLAQGPGVSGFKLSQDVIDNWQAFIGKETLFAFADLPKAHKESIVKNAYWDYDDIPGRPDTGAVTRTSIEDKAGLPSMAAQYVADVEAKTWVNTDPATTPPVASDLRKLRFRSANEIKIDDVVVGYDVWFHDNYPGVALNVDGSLMSKDIKLFEVAPDSAVGFGDLTQAQKLDALLSEDFSWDQSQQWHSLGSLKGVLEAMGTSMSDADIAAAELEGLRFVAQQLDADMEYMAGISLNDLNINLTPEMIKDLGDWDALVDLIVTRTEEVYDANRAEEVADSLGNGGSDFVMPSVEVYEENGTTIGAVFSWSVSVDGDHDYWTKSVYDNSAGAFIGGATGGYEMDTETWMDN